MRAIQELSDLTDFETAEYSSKVENFRKLYEKLYEKDPNLKDRCEWVIDLLKRGKRHPCRILSFESRYHSLKIAAKEIDKIINPGEKRTKTTSNLHALFSLLKQEGKLHLLPEETWKRVLLRYTSQLKSLIKNSLHYKSPRVREPVVASK